MQRAYQGANNGGSCGQQYQSNNAGPAADEVDWTKNYWFLIVFFS